MENKAIKKECSYVMIKPIFANYPDEINSFINRILISLQDKDIRIVSQGYIQYYKVSSNLHYDEHKTKHFFSKNNDTTHKNKGWYLQDYITKDKAFGMILEGNEGLIASVRDFIKIYRQDNTIFRSTYIQDPITANRIHATSEAKSLRREATVFYVLKNKFNTKQLTKEELELHNGTAHRQLQEPKNNDEYLPTIL